MVPATIMQIRIIIFFLVIKGSVSLVWVWTKKGPRRGMQKIQQTGNCELRVVYCNSIIPKKAKHRLKRPVGP